MWVTETLDEWAKELSRACAGVFWRGRAQEREMDTGEK